MLLKKVKSEKVTKGMERRVVPSILYNSVTGWIFGWIVHPHCLLALIGSVK